MNFIYCITTEEVPSKQFITFYKSVIKHLDCIIHLVAKPSFKNIDEFYNDNRISIRYTNELNSNLMFNKIMQFNEEEYLIGDKIFILDTDLLIQDNIFKIFDEQEFDIAITSRHYPYWYKINAGVWAIRINEKSKNFMKFFKEQLEKPTWDPFKDFPKRFNREYSKNWWCDQDFLCAIYETYPEIPIKCNIIDIGCTYNYCPTWEDKIPETHNKAKEDILSKIGDKEYKILHFKGALKNLI